MTLVRENLLYLYNNSINEQEDEGKKPWASDIENDTISNNNFRKVIWTGEYVQLVLMTLNPGKKIDLEVHEGHDQFVRIERGKANLKTGKTKENLDFDKTLEEGWAGMIPAGYWHEIENTGEGNLSLYTIYSPPEHPENTVEYTKE